MQLYGFLAIAVVFFAASHLDLAWEGSAVRFLCSGRRPHVNE